MQGLQNQGREFGFLVSGRPLEGSEQKRDMIQFMFVNVSLARPCLCLRLPSGEEVEESKGRHRGSREEAGVAIPVRDQWGPGLG